MKRLLLAVAIATLVATGVSFSLSRWVARRAEATAAHIHETGWLKATLGLSDTQAAQVEKLHAAFAARVEDSCTKHCAARFDLSNELAKPNPDATTTRACVDRMCAAQTDSERATLDHILQVRAILTPDQQKRYAALINEQICTACPLGLHKP